MAGYCEGCPIPEILEKLDSDDSAGKYWTNDAIREQLRSLIGAMIEAEECPLGPDSYEVDDGDLFIECRHPATNDIDVLSFAIGDQSDSSIVTSIQVHLIGPAHPELA